MNAFIDNDILTILSHGVCRSITFRHFCVHIQQETDKPRDAFLQIQRHG